MAGSNYILEKSYKTDTAISQFHAVKVTGTELVAQCTVLSEEVFGIAQNDVTLTEAGEGKYCAVALMGAVRVIAGGAVTTGDRVYVNASGRIITGAGISNFIGIALNDAAADGDHFDILITRDAS